MSKEKQPPVVPVVEGAAGDVEEEQPTAKSAEDRKAAAALSKLDARDDESASAGGVDQEAVKNAMNALGGASAKAEVKKVKVDQADVALLVRPHPTKPPNKNKQPPI